MTSNNEKDVLLRMVSNVWHANERATKFYEELGEAAQDPRIKAALDARAIVVRGTREKLNECFQQLGIKPLPENTRIQEVFAEDFRRELREIQAPIARKLFVLSQVVYLVQMQIGEYVALVAAADLTGHFGIGVLLESCLADKLAFAERTRRMIHRIAEERAGRWAVEKAAA